MGLSILLAGNVIANRRHVQFIRGEWLLAPQGFGAQSTGHRTACKRHPHFPHWSSTDSQQAIHEEYIP